MANILLSNIVKKELDTIYPGLSKSLDDDDLALFVGLLRILNKSDSLEELCPTHINDLLIFIDRLASSLNISTDDEDKLSQLYELLDSYIQKEHFYEEFDERIITAYTYDFEKQHFKRMHGKKTSATISLDDQKARFSYDLSKIHPELPSALEGDEHYITTYIHSFQRGSLAAELLIRNNIDRIMGKIDVLDDTGLMRRKFYELIISHIPYNSFYDEAAPLGEDPKLNKNLTSLRGTEYMQELRMHYNAKAFQDRALEIAQHIVILESSDEEPSLTIVRHLAVLREELDELSSEAKEFEESTGYSFTFNSASYLENIAEGFEDLGHRSKKEEEPDYPCSFGSPEFVKEMMESQIELCKKDQTFTQNIKEFFFKIIYKIEQNLDFINTVLKNPETSLAIAPKKSSEIENSSTTQRPAQR